MKKLVRRLIPQPLYLAMHALRTGQKLVCGPFAYNEDGFCTRDQAADFLVDDRFQKAYQAGKSTGSWIRSSEIHWRVKVVLWAAEQAMLLQGDFVECGVNRGGYARSILEYLPFESSGKKMYLLDTFEGIPDEQISQQERSAGRTAGGYVPAWEAVCKTFAPFSSVQIVKGMVPQTLDSITSEKIAYVSLDMNIAEPEIAAAHFLWPKMVSGAAMVLDDYNFTFHPVQRQKFNEFAQQKGVPILPLPTGQGMIIKP